LGPLSYEQFKKLNPQQTLFKNLIQLIRRYIPLDLSFKIQLELIAADIAYCELRNNNPIQLGWNSWLKSKNFHRNVNDIILSSLDS
jgi:predicted component of type VI protein secretion system